ncbi:zinc finger CCHC domain-containing protein 3-like [Onychomys torridus]|uniref:zinc finger CCHC domain-containing protein 3-like n=1 Tax=Onychomys torridus TaxID=38674 RepID=UPI00167FDA14|nr:zinc finger CCHC domain-containing protein 3-like [Onychomys torridus]
MATGSRTEEDVQQSQLQLLLPPQPMDQAKEAQGAGEKMGWAQVVKNLAEKKHDFREQWRGEERGAGAGGRLGSPAGLATPNRGFFPPAGRGHLPPAGRGHFPAAGRGQLPPAGRGHFPPAGRGDPRVFSRDPGGYAADACRMEGAGAGDASQRKMAEVAAAAAAAAAAMASPPRPVTIKDAITERPLQDEPPASRPGKGRFLVRICFQGEESACPTRDFVVGALILRSIGMYPEDICAVIQIPGSRQFDVSFRSADKLALFLRIYEEKREKDDCWENFVVLGRSKTSLKTIFILFQNETVDVEDIVTWLKRHCDVLALPMKVNDRFGIWTGEYKCEIELRQGEGGVRHLPGSFFLGTERGYSWYKGQPKTCFKCGSQTHMTGTCTQDRCYRCGEEGHKSPYCRKIIICNLCGKGGHVFAQCPKAVQNSVAGHLTGVAGH